MKSTISISTRKDDKKSHRRTDTSTEQYQSSPFNFLPDLPILFSGTESRNLARSSSPPRVDRSTARTGGQKKETETRKRGKDTDSRGRQAKWPTIRCPHGLSGKVRAKGCDCEGSWELQCTPDVFAHVVSDLCASPAWVVRKVPTPYSGCICTRRYLRYIGSSASPLGRLWQRCFNAEPSFTRFHHVVL